MLKLRIYFLPVLDVKGVGERSCMVISSHGIEGRLSAVMTLRVPRRERLALINRLRVDYIYRLRVVTRLRHRSSDATHSRLFAHGPDLRVQVQAGFHPIPGLPS